MISDQRTVMLNLAQRARAGRPWYGVVGLSLALVALVVVTGCERGKAASIMPARPPAQVTVAAAESRDVPVYLDEIGKTVAVENVSIIPQVGGKVIAAHVQDGADVKKGDLLFEIDPRPFEATLASAKATVAQNKAEAEQAHSEFSRMESLGNTAAMSKMEIDQKRSAWAVAEAKVLASEAAVQSAQLNLEYTKIYAPIDGRAGALLVDPGNVVKDNDKPLLVIQRLDPIYAEFSVPENDLGTVRKFIASRGGNLVNSPEKGLKVMVDVPGNSQRVLAALGAPSTQPTTTRSTAGPREGPLTFLDNSVQNGSGTIRLRATLPNADRYFWPGQFVNVRVVLETRKDAVLIPAQAEQVGQVGPFVYVVNEDSTAEIRQITPGQPQGEMMVVEKGLTPGEKVIVTGQMMVMPGGKVQVANNGSATASGR